MVSVVIPVYNKAPYMRKCLDSVLAQHYKDLEILLVDDGSTDGSAQICDEYREKDERVRVFHLENGGSSRARNYGISKANGAYVGFVDADDWVEPDMYEILVAMMEYEDGTATEEGPVMVQMMSRNFDPDGKLVIPPVREDHEVEMKSPEGFFRELILHQGDSSFCTKLIRRDFMNRYPFPEGKYNEDFALLLTMLPELHAGIPTMGTVGYNILHTPQSNSRGRYKQPYYEDLMYNAFRAYGIARDVYPEYMSEARRFTYVQALDFMLHIPVEEMHRKNAFYMRILRYLRSQKQEIRKNRYLTRKQKKYLKLLTGAPRSVRGVHRVLMRMRGVA